MPYDAATRAGAIDAILDAHCLIVRTKDGSVFARAPATLYCVITANSELEASEKHLIGPAFTRVLFNLPHRVVHKSGQAQLEPQCVLFDNGIQDAHFVRSPRILP